jgi:hypothetical protein
MGIINALVLAGAVYVWWGQTPKKSGDLSAVSRDPRV